MIRPLRTAHLRIWLCLAVLTPLILLAAFLAYKDPTPPNAGFRAESFGALQSEHNALYLGLVGAGAATLIRNRIRRASNPACWLEPARVS